MGVVWVWSIVVTPLWKSLPTPMIAVTITPVVGGERGEGEGSVEPPFIFGSRKILIE